MNTDGKSDSPQCDCGAAKRRPFLILAVLAVLAILFFRKPITDRLFERAVLSNDAPSDDMVVQNIQGAADPASELIAEWNTGKIVPRELAIRSLATLAPPGRPCPPGLETVLMAATLDPDENVRETAFGTLSARHDPALPALAAAQLTDADPEMRLLGLQYLKGVPAKVGLPLSAPLLDDADPRVITEVLVLMNDWTGEDFGVKFRDITQAEDTRAGVPEFLPESISKARAAVERAKAWIANHQADFGPKRIDIPPEALAALHPMSAWDFSLPSLDGGSVRLSDFRGKVVVLNFWTTWCTACIREMPELVELQKQNNGRVAILGTSLDFTPDDDQTEKLPAPAEIRAKIARTVRQRGITYTVLLDEKGAAGARFNGGELPTTIIIDGGGHVRRRFIGARSLPVFKALVAAASQPL